MPSAQLGKLSEALILIDAWPRTRARILCVS